MEVRVLAGYGLLACAALAVLVWIVVLVVKYFRARARRKQHWSRYYQ